MYMHTTLTWVLKELYICKFILFVYYDIGIVFTFLSILASLY